MKSVNTPSRFACVLTLSVLLCACSTTQVRIAERHAIYASATPRDQFLMRRGLVAAGFTPDMVYISMDKPDVATKLPDGHMERWIYKNYGTNNGSTVMGATKVQVVDVNGKPKSRMEAARGYLTNYYKTFIDPSAPGNTEQQHLVLTFIDGKLAGMELFTL